MRDRLIELIQDSVNGCARHWAEIIADYLLENGVIVPPCKAGDRVWYIKEGGIIGLSLVNKIRMEQKAGWNTELTFNCIYLSGFVHPIPCEQIGKAVFLTREEAEQALKEREQDDR